MERHPRPWWHRPGTRAAVLGGGNARANLNRILKYELGAVANYRADLGVTGTLNASALANQIGIAGPLLQATGANQPIVLAYSGERYAYLPGVNANDFSSPDSAAAFVPGDGAWVAKVALDDWTPAAPQALIGQDGSAGNRGACLEIETTTGTIRFYWSADGTTIIQKNSTVATGVTDGTAKWVAASHDVDNGAAGNDVKFFTSDDGVSWVQLGATVTTAGTTSHFNVTTNAVRVGARIAGLNDPSLGKFYRAQMYNGIPPMLGGTGSATPVVDWNASDWPETTTNGATKASSTTGEVWTLNNTGTKLAQIVGSSQLLFDGAAHFMKAAPFAFVQPEVVIGVFNRITYTNTDTMFDGDAVGHRMAIIDGAVAPTINLQGGTASANVNGSVANTYAIWSSVFNGAASSFQLNAAASTALNAGTNTADGFVLGGNVSGANPANLQFKEAILLNAVPSAAKLAQIIQLLNSIHTVF